MRELKNLKIFIPAAIVNFIEFNFNGSTRLRQTFIRNRYQWNNKIAERFFLKINSIFDIKPVLLWFLPFFV